MTRRRRAFAIRLFARAPRDARAVPRRTVNAIRSRPEAHAAVRRLRTIFRSHGWRDAGHTEASTTWKRLSDRASESSSQPPTRRGTRVVPQSHPRVRSRCGSSRRCRTVRSHRTHLGHVVIAGTVRQIEQLPIRRNIHDGLHLSAPIRGQSRLNRGRVPSTGRRVSSSPGIAQESGQHGSASCARV